MHYKSLKKLLIALTAFCVIGAGVYSFEMRSKDACSFADTYSGEEMRSAETILEANLGNVKGFLTSKEKKKALETLLEIEKHTDLRRKEGEFFYGEKEEALRNKFLDILDEATVRAYPQEADVSGFDEDIEVDLPENNKERVLKYFFRVLKTPQFHKFSKLYIDYMDNYDVETYDEIIKLLTRAGIEDPQVYFCLLENYDVEQTQAVFRINEKLELEEKQLFSKDGRGSVFRNFMKRFGEDSKIKPFHEKDLLWKRIRSVIETENLKKFDYVIVTTDGEDNSLASVIESPDGKRNGERWLLQVDSQDMGYELEDTLIHEYGHYLTLNEKEVDYTDEYDLNRYCEVGLVAKENSFINRFYQKFWKDYRISYTPTDHLFYIRHRSSFVSDYAATDPAEDVAETFLHFVAGEKPKGNSIAEKKILFFYEDKRLVKSRAHIRKQLGLD
ncbi:MAG: hypothetical protein Q3993_08675 [Filifactor alocis]|nr:hypothetical protein [Filifactor alocis]